MGQAQQFRLEICFIHAEINHQKVLGTLQRLHNAEDDLFWPMLTIRTLSLR